MTRHTCKYALLESPGNRIAFKIGQLYFVPVKENMNKIAYTVTEHAAVENWPIPIFVRHGSAVRTCEILSETGGRREVVYSQLEVQVKCAGEKAIRGVSLDFVRLEGFIPGFDDWFPLRDSEQKETIKVSDAQRRLFASNM